MSKFFFFGFRPSLSLAAIFLFYVLVVTTNAETFQLCVDHECKEIISYGKTTQNYNPPKTGMLRFKSDEDAKILVKNVGGNPAYLRVQINNDIGIVPKNMVKEEQVYVSSEVLVSVPVQTIGKEGQFSVSSSGIPIDIDGKDGGAGMLKKDIDESIKESSALGLEDIEYTSMKNLTPDDNNRPPNDTVAQSNTTHGVPNSGASVAVDGFKIPESAVETKDGIKDEDLVKPETESKLSDSEPFDTMDKDGEIGMAGHGSHQVQRTPEAEPHFAKAKENSEASEVSGHGSDQVPQNSEAEPHFVKAKDELSGHGSDHVPKTPETQPHFEKENNNLNSEASQITGHADSNDIPQNSNVRGSDQYLSEAVLESTRFVNDQVKEKLNEQGGVNNEVKQGINNLDTPEAAIGNIAPENGTVATRETDNEDESNGNGEENGSEYLSNDDKLLPENKKQSEPTQKPDVQTADHVTPTAPKSEVYEGTTLYPQSSGESANPGYHVENTGSRKPYDSRKYRPTPIPYPNMLHRNSGSFGGKTEKERPGTQESLEENKEQKGYIQPDSDGADHLLEKTYGTEVTPAPQSFSTAENTSPGSVDSSNENKATMDESITTPGPMWDSSNKNPSGMNNNEEFSVPKDKSILSDIKPSLEDNTHNNQPEEELKNTLTSSIPEEQSVEVTSSPEMPDLDNSLVYPDEKESDSDDKLDTVEEDQSNSPEVEDEASMKLGEDAVCRLKDYFLFITGVMLPEGIMIAIEEEVSSPYMSRGKFILLVVIASTIVILYLCHLFMVKISREGPILEAMNCIDRKLRVIQEENNNLKQSSLGLTSKSFGVTPEYIELQKAKERTDRIEKALKDKVDELVKKNEQLETDLESSQANEDELNKMLNEILASQKKTTNFEDAVNQLQSMLDSQQKEVDGLKSDLAVKTRLNEELKTELKANKNRSSKLEYQIEQLSRSLEEMTASKLELSKRVSEDEKTMNSLKDENSSLKEDMKEAKQETARLGKESARFSEEIRSLKKKLSAKEAECQVSKECLKKLQIYSDTNGKDAHSKLMETFKVIEMKSSLESFEHSFENQSEELSSQTVALQEAKGQITDLESTVRQAEDRAERASKVRDDALARLQVLGDHFKERETQLERELETRDSLLRDAEGTAVSGTTRLQTYDVELKSCRNQIENLRKELDSQEQSYKKQLANEENKLLDSWMNTRSAERRQEELRQENAQLRQLLTQAHKSTEGGGGPVVKPTPKRAESNGSVSSPVTVEGTPFGPLPPPLMPPPFHGGPPHIPPPGFLPPPMFGHLPPPPPMMPDRRRLPPAGRMASPPGVDRRSYSPSSNHSSYSDRRYSPDLSHSPERGRRYRGPHSPQEQHHHYRRGPSPEHWYHQSPPHYPHSPPGSLDSFDSRGGDGRPNRSKKTSTPANYGER